VVGIGTNAYNLTDEMRPVLRDVMKRFDELGGSVYDSATGYGRCPWPRTGGWGA